MNKFLFLILISVSCLSAQEMDSLYNSFLRFKNQPHEIKNIGDEIEPSKCGFGLIGSIRQNFNNFDELQKLKIQQLRSRPILQKSIVSPSNLFRIHFDTTGTDIPGYDVDELAIAYDSAYNFEVNILGYDPPPSDGNLGGDDKYDVYISGKATADYGYTDDEINVGDDRFISHIVMHNNFIGGFFTSGIEAAKVTAAHEFHHAIQMGNYILRWSDVFYYELTSTAFEEFVFDDVNDYYAYMPQYFNSTQKSLKDQEGYDIAVFHIFLKERFHNEDPMLGYKIVKKSWELMRDNDSRAIVALASAMQEISGYSFAQIYNEFGDWLNFTKNKAKAGEFFEEAANYPLVRSTYNYELTGTSKNISLQTNPTSINYVTFMDYTQGFADTIVAVLSNSDVNGSLGSNNITEVQFEIANESFEGSLPINDTYFSKISGQNAGFVQSSFIINNKLADNQSPHSEINFAYPQPFNYEVNNLIYFPTSPDLSNTSELKIYSPDMNLVFSGKLPISQSGNIVVHWNGLDNSGGKLASGVYIYVTMADDDMKKGKFIILN